MNSVPHSCTEEEFEALSRHAAAQSQGGEAQNISMLDQWAIENAELLSKIEIVGSKFTQDEQITLSRWIGQDPELLRSLIPESPPKPANKINWDLLVTVGGWVAVGAMLIVAAPKLIQVAGMVWVPQNTPLEKTASKNIEIADPYVPSSEDLQKVIRHKADPPYVPIPPAIAVKTNATVQVPSDFDCLSVRNFNGLEIGCVYPGDRVLVIKDDGGDRVTIKTPALTGSVFRLGIKED